MMSFHNFQHLIGMHKRPFSYYIKSNGATNEDTGRYEQGNYGNEQICYGVFETVNEKDLKKFPEGDISVGDIKVTTTPSFMSNISPKTKDKIIYNGEEYYVHRVRNDVHYGNFYIFYLKTHHSRI